MIAEKTDTVKIINPDFWDLWREKKIEIKSRGYSVFKNGLDYFLTSEENINSDIIDWLGMVTDEFPSSFLDNSKNDKPVFKKESEVVLDEDKIKNINSLLLDSQKNHFKRILKVLERKRFVLDASDTGEGKTFVASAVAKYYKSEVVYVGCSSQVFNNWKLIMRQFGIYDVRNIRPGILSRKDPRDKSIWNGKEFHNYVMDKEENLIIIDEVHRWANCDSNIGKSLLKLKEFEKAKFMLLSATPIRSASMCGSLLNFLEIENLWDYKKLINQKSSMTSYGFRLLPHQNSSICKLFNKKILDARVMSFVTRDEKIKRPKSMISNLPIDIEKEKMNDLYIKLRRFKNSGKSGYADFVKTLVEIEFNKVEGMIEHAISFVEKGIRPVVFFNYKKSVYEFFKNKDIKNFGIMTGDSKLQDCIATENDFQNNKLDGLVMTTEKGGESFSFHDFRGDYPRVSLLSTLSKGVEFTQALGRIDRANTKSEVRQFICYVPGTLEEKVFGKLELKLDYIKDLKDWYL